MRLASYQRLIPRKNGGSSVLFDFLDIDELEEGIRENSGKNRQMTKEWGERLGICVKNGEIAEETASMFLQGYTLASKRAGSFLQIFGRHAVFRIFNAAVPEMSQHDG